MNGFISQWIIEYPYDVFYWYAYQHLVCIQGHLKFWSKICHYDHTWAAQVGSASRHFKGAKTRAPTCFCGENHIVGVVFTHGSTSAEKFIKTFYLIHIYSGSIYMFSESVKIMMLKCRLWWLITDWLMIDFYLILMAMMMMLMCNNENQDVIMKKKSDFSPTSELRRGFRDFGRWVAATKNVW